MDVSKLKRDVGKPPDKKVAVKKSVAKKSEHNVVEAQYETAAPPSTNLHKPVRGERIPRQFKLTQDTSQEFDITALEKGYNKRQGSEFFEVVWRFWKAHN